VYDEQRRFDESIAAYQAAIAANPRYTKAYNNLGNTLRDQRKWGEAVVAFQKAVALEPKHELAWYNMGLAFSDQRRWAEAEKAFAKATVNKPGDHVYHAALGKTHYWQGAFGQAEAATRRALDLLPPDNKFLSRYQQRLEICRRLLALEKRLPMVLAGKDKASTSDLLEMAQMCQRLKQQFRAAAQLYQEAFEA